MVFVCNRHRIEQAVLAASTHQSSKPSQAKNIFSLPATLSVAALRELASAQDDFSDACAAFNRQAEELVEHEAQSLQNAQEATTAVLVQSGLEN